MISFEESFIGTIFWIKFKIRLKEDILLENEDSKSLLDFFIPCLILLKILYWFLFS
jgi:hypothetical protein